MHYKEILWAAARREMVEADYATWYDSLNCRLLRDGASDMNSPQHLGVILVLSILLLCPVSGGWTKDMLPVEPDLNTRLDELYDHEARLFLMLYSLQGNGQVDYVTGRMVQDYARSNFGNPVYQTEAHPLFYWWNHTMWNDPEQDGVNGNERIYQENVDFDVLRYKPCTFNGQPC